VYLSIAQRARASSSSVVSLERFRFSLSLASRLALYFYSLALHSALCFSSLQARRSAQLDSHVLSSRRGNVALLPVVADRP